MRKTTPLMVSLVIMTIVNPAMGQEQKVSERQKDKLSITEYGYLTGWGKGSLRGRVDDYEITPLILRYGFDLRPLTKRVNPPDLFELEVEPFLSTVFGPETNLEVGCGLLLKYAHPITDHIFPYIEIGTGLIYTTQHVKEQSTQLNSLVQTGCGLHYFLCENKSLNIGYRFRHFSNAGIKEPNEGVDIHCFLIGISFFY